MQYDAWLKDGKDMVDRFTTISRRLKKEAEIIDNMLKGIYTTEIDNNDYEYFQNKDFDVRMDDFTMICTLVI